MHDLRRRGASRGAEPRRAPGGGERPRRSAPRGARSRSPLRPLAAAFVPFAIGLLAAFPAASGMLDPRLLPLAAHPSSETVHVWASFRDKGAAGPIEMAAALERAAATLGPRDRARRLRAHVTPLVDELDLPVCPRYLDSLTARGFAPHAVSRWFNRAAVRVTGARLEELAALPFVDRVSPVARARVDLAPYAPSGGFAPAPRSSPQGTESGAGSPRRAERVEIDHGLLGPALQILGIPALHDSGYAGQGVLVAILDEGFDNRDQHEALVSQVIAPGRQRDFVDDDSVVTGGGHGTIVLGCIAGDKPGRYVGAAFGAEYALARTEIHSLEAPVEMLNWGRAAEWADSLGADLISSSLGYSTFDDASYDYTYADMDGHTTEVSRAAEIAASKGILVVNSVGNSGNAPWHYLIAPADVNGDSLIAAGAIRFDGAPASFSSFGPSADGRIKPDLAAPGVEVPVVAAGSDPAGYAIASGTSISAPLIAGLAACIMQARPAWTPQQVIRALRETASRARDPDPQLGYGIPNGPAALGWFRPRGRLGLALEGANPLRAGDRLRAVFALAATELRPASARVRVFDAAGRAVRGLWAGTLEPGRPLEAAWDGTGDGGRTLAPGLYWIAIDAARNVASARVALLR